MVKITALQLVCYKLLAAQAAINNAAVAPKRTNALGVYKEPRIQDDPYCIVDDSEMISLFCFVGVGLDGDEYRCSFLFMFPLNAQTVNKPTVVRTRQRNIGQSKIAAVKC